MIVRMHARWKKTPHFGPIARSNSNWPTLLRAENGVFRRLSCSESKKIDSYSHESDLYSFRARAIWCGAEPFTHNRVASIKFWRQTAHL